MDMRKWYSVVETRLVNNNTVTRRELRSPSVKVVNVNEVCIDGDVDQMVIITYWSGAQKYARVISAVRVVEFLKAEEINHEYNKVTI